MSKKYLACLILAASLLFAVGCSQSLGSPAGGLSAALEGQAAKSILDGAHEGDEGHFFFLPPMVPNPSFSGSFDGTLSPEVRIIDQASGEVLRLFTMQQGDEGVRLEKDHYQVVWHTKECELQPERTYRVVVSVAAEASLIKLGHADLDVVGTGRELKNVVTSEFVPLLDDRSLPIKFRIEAGAKINPPVAAFTALPLAGQAPLRVDFDASGSMDADGDDLSFEWSFGDGGAGAGVTVSHTYDAAGSYTVALVARDGRGGEGFAYSTVTVQAASTVYAAGCYFNGLRNVPCYWRGTDRFDLDLPESDADGGGTATSMAVSGGTVYTAGYYTVEGVIFPCYWTGTARIDLPVGIAAGAGEGRALAVSGGTVYTAGFYSDAGRLVPCYWAGTAKTDLPGDGSHDARALAITVADGSVYAAGYYGDGARNVACYWKDSARIALHTSWGVAKSAEARAIAVVAGTVYTAGCIVDNSYERQAVRGLIWAGSEEFAGGLWSGAPGELPRTVNAIAVGDGAIPFVDRPVHCAGDHYVDFANLPFTSACYWTSVVRHGGNSRTDLPIGGGDGRYAEAFALAVADGEFYTAGAYFDGSGITPCYWRGAARTDLPGGTASGIGVATAYAYALAVAE